MQMQEANVQSYLEYPGLDCPMRKPDDNIEMCTYPDPKQPLLESTMVQQKNNSWIVKREPVKGEDVQCLGDAGAPLWKVHEFVNVFGRNQDLAVLTGIISR